MLIKRAPDLTYSDITPKPLYSNRREFLASIAAIGAVGSFNKLMRLVSAPGAGSIPVRLNGVIKGPYTTDEKPTPFEDVTRYNNFYEFGTGKEDPAQNARSFKTSPWIVTVDGEVKKPRKFSMDDIMNLAPLEERIYRHRCVETWSTVIPWIGYSFNALVKLVEPTSNAQFVAFQSYYDPQQMPEAKGVGIEFPYVEGLRIDEALHPLTLLCVGMYGQTLPTQDGAPVRMIVPWKYGFKGIKSIVRIRFVKDQPPTTWSKWRGYGFYSNVNPNVDGPRSSQAKERRLGEFFRRPTVMFNGYGDQVASMYSGMDFQKYF